MMPPPPPCIGTSAAVEKKFASGVSYDGRTIVLKHSWEKAKQSGKTPWELVIQLILLTFVMLQIWFYNIQVAEYVRIQSSSWNRFFLGDAGFEDERERLSSNSLLFTKTEVTTLVDRIVDGYYNVKNESVSRINYSPGLEADNVSLAGLPGIHFSWTVLKGSSAELFNPSIEPEYHAVVEHGLCECAVNCRSFLCSFWFDFLLVCSNS